MRPISHCSPLAASVAACLATISVAVAGEAARPNVVLIYTDDQGYGDVSCLNPESKFRTPTLDRIAREGIVFTDAHSSDTVCTPSRYGLLTGRYAWRTELKRGVFGAERRCLIEDGRVTLASLLRDHGYATGMVGKWHLGMEFPGKRGNRDWTRPVLDMPLDKGFDTFWGIPASMNYGILAWFDGRYAAVPPTQYTQKKPNRIAISDYRIKPPYNDTMTDPGSTNRWGVVDGSLEVAPDFVDVECLTRSTDEAVRWIDRRADAAGDDDRTPFFLYVAYTSPHKPVIPRPRFRGQGDAGAYGEFMVETDWQIGRILRSLERAGIADETLVIVTSDNGPENTWRARADRYDHQSNGSFREGKRSIHEGGHRVPLLIRWPAVVDAGRHSDRLVCQTDLLATFAEMLGVRLADSAGEDSVSFYRTLTGESQTDRRPPVVHHSAWGGFAIRDGEWKLVMRGKRQQRALYNLSDDPSETKDVLEAHPQIAAGLTKKLSTIVREGRTTEGDRQPNDTGWWDDLTWMTRQP